MPIHDDLGTRMKEYYEKIPKTKLMRRMPVIIRIDGKAFHSFTKGFKRPFDEILIKSMQETTKYLCENIQGCVFGYTQSDEITLVLVDYQKFETSAWFDYEVQKMCSVAASMATMAFNKYFKRNAETLIKKYRSSVVPQSVEIGLEIAAYHNALEKAVEKGAMFDARVFNIPKEEVTNCLYWRQLDASRNSIQMVGQANFSHKELHHKSCSNIQDMLMEEKGINWNDYPTHQKRGTCVIKKESFEPNENSDEYTSINGKPVKGHWRSHWVVDKEIPIFKGEGRNYIERLINFE